MVLISPDLRRRRPTHDNIRAVTRPRGNGIAAALLSGGFEVI
jgi:hypothetical protein